MSLEAAMAVHRFGLGARPGEIARAEGDPKAWLLAQLDSPPSQLAALSDMPLKSGSDLVADLFAYYRTAKSAKGDPVENFKMQRVPIFVNELATRFATGFTTEAPFAERLVWFWSNHFTVSAQNPRALTLCGAFEREAIRPNISGKFEDMLLAVVRHPAMLLYLDNAQSIGPDSLAGKFAGKGLNENLGRELMELHTLGVNGGYTQADVIALAQLLTGWSIDKDGGGENGFRYYPARHEPGTIALRGKSYSGGEEAGIAALKDLAHDPATARHIAKKFAVHFIADDPPADSVANLERTFVSTGGDLKALAKTAVEDPAAWRPRGKLRKPVEYVTAAMRSLGWPRGNDRDKQAKAVVAAARLMGELPLGAPSPKGWPDDSASWSGADAVLNRVEWARELGNRIPQGVDIAALADETLRELLRPATRAAVKAAPSSGEALALLLASPEFQRR